MGQFFLPNKQRLRFLVSCACLAHFLIKLYVDFGEDQYGNLRLYVKREDMASYLGVTIESIIRMLKSFEKKGLIRIEGKLLKLKDISELRNISTGFKF